MSIKYIVNLDDDERAMLRDLTKKGKVAARKVARAQILLHADTHLSDDAIAAALHVSVSTVHRTRQRCVEAGVAAALTERPRPGAKRLLDGKQEALIIATACTPAPTGHARWTMQLLADRVVEIEVVEAISDETVRRVLKKTNSSPGCAKNGASPV